MIGDGGHGVAGRVVSRAAISAPTNRLASMPKARAARRRARRRDACPPKATTVVLTFTPADLHLMDEPA